MVSMVLGHRSEIKEARKELRKQGLSFIDPAWKKLLRRVKRDWGGGVGDYLKSWDVQLAAQFVSENVKKILEF